MRTAVLIILDGWGYAPDWGGNAITEARTPNFDQLWKNFPHTTIQASGKYVGLPGHEMGNSEVGHLNLGAGRVVRQDIKRINSAIRDGLFFRNKVLLRAMREARDKGKKLHLLGLLSDGGVHSHISHLFSLLDLCKQEKVKDVYIHVFSDGRDSDPMTAINFMSHLVDKIKATGCGKIATVLGRYFAMDRDSKFDRTNKAYEAMVEAKGEKVDNPLHAISESYKKGVTDEFVEPVVCDAGGIIEDGDSIISFNFRADRMRQLTTFLLDKDFHGYRRKKILKNLFYVSLVPYYEYDLGLPFHTAFAPKLVKNPLAEVISEKNLAQFRIAESEKYAHVTYFFNGAREKPFEGEDRILVPSPKVKTYDLKPEMSSEEVTKRLIKAIRAKKYTFILVNYANPDMVGHTGNFEAVVKAVEKVDEHLGKVTKEIKRIEAEAIITADHGNAETMINIQTGEPHTEHTNNPVPLILFDKGRKTKGIEGAALSNVAPTILEILGVEKPKVMDKESLIAKSDEEAKVKDYIEYRP